MDDELEQDETTTVGGSPQSGPAAGGSATSENTTTGEKSSVGSDNTADHSGDELDDDKTDELEGGPGDHDDDPDDDGDEQATGPLARARRQAARYRTELRDLETRHDELVGSLWHARLELDGRLADPDDLPVDPELVDDPDGLRAAVDELLERKPHLRSRRIRDRAGQGEGSTAASVSLAELLRRGA